MNNEKSTREKLAIVHKGTTDIVQLRHGESEAQACKRRAFELKNLIQMVAVLDVLLPILFGMCTAPSLGLWRTVTIVPLTIGVLLLASRPSLGRWHGLNHRWLEYATDEELRFPPPPQAPHRVGPKREWL